MALGCGAMRLSRLISRVAVCIVAIFCVAKLFPRPAGDGGGSDESKKIMSAVRCPSAAAIKHDWLEPPELTRVVRGNRVQSKATLVTGWFTMKSKFPSVQYIEWMSNLLQLTDAMVIFTEADSADMMLSKRAGLEASTFIVPTRLDQGYVAQRYGEEFWDAQFQCDPENYVHKSTSLYWVWLEKSNFLKQAIELNPFESEFFAWVDVGYFRSSTYNGEQLVQRIPRGLNADQVLMLQVEEFPRGQLKLRDGMLVNPFVGQGTSGAYVGGGFIGGYVAGLLKWHSHFYDTLDLYKKEGFFIGKDQPAMATTCLERIERCYLVGWPQSAADKAKYGDLWFFMAPVLHGDVPERLMARSVDAPSMWDYGHLTQPNARQL